MILLKLGAINGLSDIADHEKWITIDSLQFGVGRAISIVGGGADRDTSNPSFSEITVSKSMDISSPDIFAEAIAGKAADKAELHFIQTAGTQEKPQVFLKLTLISPLVSSYSMSSGGERPSESLSINFTKIEYQYDSFSGDKVTTGTPKKWDLVKNQKY
jgi:type VI secretion system secreted protein Hcp